MEFKEAEKLLIELRTEKLIESLEVANSKAKSEGIQIYCYK